MFSTDYVTAVDGSDIHYSKFGFGKKKVLLLHGFFGKRSMWASTLPQLADFMLTHTFIIPDLRGHGESEHTDLSSKNVFLDMGADLSLIIDKETDPEEKLTVVAYSMGVVATLAFFTLYGQEKLERLVLIDHALDWNLCRVFTNEHQEFFSTLSVVIDYIRSDPEHHGRNNLRTQPRDMQRMVERLFDIIFQNGVVGGGMSSILKSPIMIPISTKIAHVATEFPIRWVPYSLIGNSYVENEHDFHESARRITVPTTFMLGMATSLFDTTHYYDHIRDAVPHADIYKFAKSGHSLIWNEPLRFIQLLRQELRS